MVKGRPRAKPAVVCNGVGECCSPVAKRRGKQPKANGNLDVYLQVKKVTVEEEEEEADNNNVTKTPKTVRSSVPKTATPHRIELCDEAPPKPRKLTEYFPVRRSVRKTKTLVLEEKQLSLEKALRDGTEDGLVVETFEGKGRGVVAAKPFEKGDFVVEYSGELIDIVEAKRREERYSTDTNAGCYMYYFKHNGQQFCIDATAETGKLGRLVNHSRNGNLVTRTVNVDGVPRLVLIARSFIEAGEEVVYDYGDRSKESLHYHPWLAN